MTEFDPELVEQAARAIAVVHTQNPDDTPFIRSRKAALAVLTAVAPTLRAEGEVMERTWKKEYRKATARAERWKKAAALNHDRAEQAEAEAERWAQDYALARKREETGYQRGKVDGAREVHAAVKREADDWASDIGAVPGVEACRRSAREAVARIEKGGAS